MKDMNKQLTDQMLNTYLDLEKAFIWESNLAKHFAALIFTQSDKQFTKESMKSAIDVINQNTGVFSNFRGYYRFMLASMMIAESDSVEGTFARILNCESLLKQAGFKSSTHLPIASYTLYRASKGENNVSLAHKSFEVYTQMKSNHPFLTSSDDYAMAILLAQSGGDMDRIERIYKILNANGFYQGNALQMLSHILALSNQDADRIAQTCVQLKATLKANQLNLASNFYAALGIVTLICLEDANIIHEWVDVSQYLMKLKKYKWLGKGMNVLLASAIVSDQWIKENQMESLSNTAIGLTVETLIAAQMAALIAASTAAATAAAASNSAATS